MDLNYIRNLTIQKRSKIKHLYAAISLLLVAAIMMSTATYAWLILSTAPAATGVTTTVGANGSLEIALSTADHLESLSATNMFEEDPFFEYATGEAYHDNVLWGNIVDLADSRYGLNNVILRPSVLNIIENILQVSNPLITVSYGQDGRITYEDNYSGVGAFDPGSQSYQGNKGRDYGVRVAGTPLDAELMQRIEGLASAANLKASTLLSGNTDFLLDVCYYEDTAQMTDTAELRGFLNDVIALNGTYQNAVEAIDAAFGSEAADPEADALLKEIQENYSIANEKLNAADTALKQLEPEVKEEEETPEPVALTMAAAHEIIAPLFGDLKLYAKEYAEDGRTFEWVPVTGTIPTNQAVRIELGQDSYFQLLGALSGSYAMSGEYPSDSAGQGSNTTGSAEWTAVIEDYSQVFKLESETMASKYEIYLEEYETYSKQLNTYADKMQNLVNREYQDEVRFFYEYALHPLPDSETGLPDETTQPFTSTELEAYVSAIDGRVDELEEIVTFLEDYTKAAVMVYASSGILDRETFQNVVAVNLANGSLRMHLESAELMGNADFALILEKSENARASIADWRKGVEDLNKELNPRNKNGDVITEQVRDMSVADLLKVWDHIENMTGMTISNIDMNGKPVGNYGLKAFAENARKTFVQRVYTVNPSYTGLYRTIIRLQKSAWGSHYVNVSNITYREHSDTQYLQGVRIYVNGSYWEYNYQEDQDACTLQFSRNRLSETFEDVHGEALWENAYENATSAIEAFNNMPITQAATQLIVDAVLERLISGAEDGYSRAYYDLMVSLLADTETIMDNLEDALAKQVLLYAAGMAAREIKENAEALENTEPDFADGPTEPKTEHQDLYAEAKEAWEKETWTLDQLLQKVDFSDGRAFDAALKIYRDNLPLLKEAQDALEKLEMRELSWVEIDSVLSNYWIDDVTVLAGYHSLYTSTDTGIFADVQYAMNHYYKINLGIGGYEIGPSPYGYSFSGLPRDIDEQYCNVGLTDVEQKLDTHISYIVEDPLYQIEKLIDRTEDGQGNTMSDREFVFQNETLQMDSASTLAQQYYSEYAQTESDLLQLLYRCGLSHASITPKQDETKYTAEDIANAEAALGILSKAVDSAMECMVHTLRASAASSSTDESTYQEAIQFNTSDELLKALNLGEGNVLFDLHQDLSALEADIESASEGLAQARYKLDNKAATEGVLTQQVFASLAPVQELKLNGMAIPDFRNLISNLDAPYMVNGENYGGWTVAQMLSNRGVSFASSSGALSTAHSLFGTSATASSTYQADPISVGTEDNFVSDISVTLATDSVVSGNLNNSISWVYASGAPSEPSASGGNTDSNYIIGNTYAIAIDFLLRTNATGANLLLQTEGIQRIYSDDSVRNNDRYDAEEIEAMQGKGSFIQLHNDDPVDARAWEVLQNPAAEEDLVMAAKRQLGSEIMEALRVAFVDTLTGEIYAYAKADWLDFDYENRTITAELKLVDEYGYEIPNAILKPLVQNQVSAISAWLYMDGTEISNASVDSEKLGALTMNLQFATDAFLNPAYSENKESAVTPSDPSVPIEVGPASNLHFEKVNRHIALVYDYPEGITEEMDSVCYDINLTNETLGFTYTMQSRSNSLLLTEQPSFADGTHREFSIDSTYDYDVAASAKFDNLNLEMSHKNSTDEGVFVLVSPASPGSTISISGLTPNTPFVFCVGSKAPNGYYLDWHISRVSDSSGNASITLLTLSNSDIANQYISVTEYTDLFVSADGLNASITRNSRLNWTPYTDGGVGTEKNQRGTLGDNISWAYTTDGTLRISGSGAMEDGLYPWSGLRARVTNVIIEDGITTVARSALKGFDQMTSLYLSKDLIEIEEDAFWKCYKLQSIDLPNGLVVIGDAAFRECGAIKDVIIPDSVTRIGVMTFAQCSRLKSVTLSKHLKHIPQSAFDYCSSLKNIVIPEGVLKIYSQAFHMCTAMETITLPSSLENVLSFAFGACDSLTDVYYNGSPSMWNSIDISVTDNQDLTNSTIHYAMEDPKTIKIGN